MKTFVDGLLFLFFPRLCFGCNKGLLPVENVLCLHCVMQLPQTHYHKHPLNETASRFVGKLDIAHATTFCYFINDGLLQHLIHGLKYGNRLEIGKFLGSEFGKSLKDCEWIYTVDLIIPVPLHPKKLKKRGFNQSFIIAEGLSNILNIPTNDNYLERVRATETQTHKSREERIANMKDAFKVKEKGSLNFKHVLLCDDVLTTGATLSACAKALLEEENIKVSIVTVGIVL